MSDADDGRYLEEIPLDECIALLRSMSVGRIAVALPAEGDSPLVVPVNYVVDGDVVVFRTDPGSKLDRLHETSVSFQVDLIDPFHRTGWSVLVRGVAREASADEAEHVHVQSWAGGPKLHWVRVTPLAITGRRIRLPELPERRRGGYL